MYTELIIIIIITPTYAQSAIHESSVQAGSAALKAEVNKSRKYADIIAGVDFIPFAIETSGVVGHAGLGVGIRDWSTSDINDA